MGVFHIDHAPELSIEDTRFGFASTPSGKCRIRTTSSLRITNQ